MAPLVLQSFHLPHQVIQALICTTYCSCLVIFSLQLKLHKNTKKFPGSDHPLSQYISSLRVKLRTVVGSHTRGAGLVYATVTPSTRSGREPSDACSSSFVVSDTNSIPAIKLSYVFICFYDTRLWKGLWSQLHILRWRWVFFLIKKTQLKSYPIHFLHAAPLALAQLFPLWVFEILVSETVLIWF